MGNKWEYMILNLPEAEYGMEAVEKLFSDAGSDLWELVTIINHPTPKMFFAESQSPFFAFFKRQKVT